MSKLAINGGKPIRKKPFPAYNNIGKEEKQAVNRILDSGILSRYLGCWDEDFYGGPEVRAFEKEWAKYFKVKHAIAVNSCTTGLQCAVGAAEICPGDEVIVPPYTMSASVTAPLWYGGIPVFADIEEEYFCIDPKSIEQKITKKTKAIIAVDIFGQPYNADTINKIAKKNNLIIIEDCAQAPGAKYKKKFAGTLGDIGVYSLNYHKHIHTGEGGMVVTDNDELAERIRLIRNHAESVVKDKGETNLVNMIGSNFRLTEIQAAIGREQLKKLDKLNKQRINNCNYLTEKLSKIPGIYGPKIRKDATHVYYFQSFLYNEKIIGIDRDQFIEAVKAELPATKMREKENALIECGYVKPLYLLPLFKKKKGLCPITERLHEKELFTHEIMKPPMRKKDLDDVVKAFEKVYQFKKELK